MCPSRMFLVFHMANNTFTLGVAIALVVLLALLTDPFMLWMPAPAQMTALLGAATLAALWAGFVIREKARDEREAAHAMHAGRLAYFSGIATLTVALVVQGLAHDIDIWVPLALGIMVVSKLGARLYAERYK